MCIPTYITVFCAVLHNIVFPDSNNLYVTHVQLQEPQIDNKVFLV